MYDIKIFSNVAIEMTVLYIVLGTTVILNLWL